jgi:hypothetical protein
VTAHESLAVGAAALTAGHWEDARTTFEDAVAARETGEGHFGLAAALWWEVADDFVQTYGCPFLYAECRIYYGSVLGAGRPHDDPPLGVTVVRQRRCVLDELEAQPIDEEGDGGS